MSMNVNRNEQDVDFMMNTSSSSLSVSNDYTLDESSNDGFRSVRPKEYNTRVSQLEKNNFQKLELNQSKTSTTCLVTRAIYNKAK